jgi:hypothetical protein
VSTYAFGERQLAVVTGFESKASYLTRLVYDYQAMEYIVSRLPPDARVLQLWDGQGYYCDGRCIPDAGQVLAPYLHSLGPGIEEMRHVLRARGATHLLIDLEGLNFLLQHDPKGAHLAAARFFLNEFLPACGEQVYQDPLVRIYRLTCLAQSASNKPRELLSPAPGAHEIGTGGRDGSYAGPGVSLPVPGSVAPRPRGLGAGRPPDGRGPGG